VVRQRLLVTAVACLGRVERATAGAWESGSPENTEAIGRGGQATEQGGRSVLQGLVHYEQTRRQWAVGDSLDAHTLERYRVSQR
jgi:hypothetical protein